MPLNDRFENWTPHKAHIDESLKEYQIFKITR